MVRGVRVFRLQYPLAMPNYRSIAYSLSQVQWSHNYRGIHRAEPQGVKYHLFQWLKLVSIPSLLVITLILECLQTQWMGTWIGRMAIFQNFTKDFQIFGLHSHVPIIQTSSLVTWLLCCSAGFMKPLLKFAMRSKTVITKGEGWRQTSSEEEWHSS